MDNSPSGTTQSFDVPGNPAEAYQAYMVPTMFQPWSEELLRRAMPNPGDRVLDIACGTGVVARGAAALVGAGGAVTGLDPSPAMLEVAERLGSPEGAGITWVQGKGEALPFSDDAFDIVLCQQGMQFFTDRLAAVREMRRVLGPGGRAAVSVWRGPEHQSVKGAFLLALQEWFGPGALKPYSFPDGDAVRQLFVDAGFRDVTLEIVRRQHFAASADELFTMTIMGASAAVPALAQASIEEKEHAITAVRERLAADIEQVRVEDGISYPMESHIVLATA